MTVSGRMGRSATAWTALGLFCLYWPIACLVPRGPMLDALQAVRIAIGLAVTAAYAPVCVGALLMPKPDRVHQLSLGIVTAWTATILSGAWALLWGLSGQPAWMMQSGLGGFWLWLQILGGVLHVTAPGAIDGEVPRRNWIALGLAFGGGALLGATIVGLRRALPDFGAALGP